MPSENVNGLKEHAKDLLENPRQLRLVIAVVDVEQATQKFDKGITVPRLRVRHIELVGEKNVASVQKLLAKELAARTGADQLPFPEGTEAPVDFEGDDEWAEEAAQDNVTSIVDSRSDEERDAGVQ